MWTFFAFGSAFFSGITAILAKCGIQKTDSTVATAVRTVIVLLFSWLMVFLVGSQETIGTLTAETWIFLVLSGLATGASWLCYFRALQIGDINKVVPVDKSSTILTMLLAFLFFHEGFTWLSGTAVVLIAAGTILMIQKAEDTDSAVGAETAKIAEGSEAVKAGWDRENAEDVKAAGAVKVAGAGNNAEAAAAKIPGPGGKLWFVYAGLSAVFASLTSILGKVGIENVESNLGTAIRTAVVLLMAWVMVFVTGKKDKVREIPRKELLFICLSGIATGGAWLCYYRALQDGPASVVVPVDKLSILVTIAFSYVVFKERLTKKSGAGLAMIVCGTLLMVVPTL